MRQHMCTNAIMRSNLGRMLGACRTATWQLYMLLSLLAVVDVLHVMDEHALRG